MRSSFWPGGGLGTQEDVDAASTAKLLLAVTLLPPQMQDELVFAGGVVVLDRLAVQAYFGDHLQLQVTCRREQ